MSCRCKNNKNIQPSDYSIIPDQHCILCAEKHISTAYALYTEFGYMAMNTQKIIGEIVCATWHIYTFDYALAKILRNLRHSIQKREVVAEEVWSKILTKFDELVVDDNQK